MVCFNATFLWHFFMPLMMPLNMALKMGYFKITIPYDICKKAKMLKALHSKHYSILAIYFIIYLRCHQNMAFSMA